MLRDHGVHTPPISIYTTYKCYDDFVVLYHLQVVIPHLLVLQGFISTCRWYPHFQVVLQVVSPLVGGIPIYKWYPIFKWYHLLQ